MAPVEHFQSEKMLDSTFGVDKGKLDGIEMSDAFKKTCAEFGIENIRVIIPPNSEKNVTCMIGVPSSDSDLCAPVLIVFDSEPALELEDNDRPHTLIASDEFISAVKKNFPQVVGSS